MNEPQMLNKTLTSQTKQTGTKATFAVAKDGQEKVFFL